MCKFIMELINGIEDLKMKGSVVVYISLKAYRVMLTSSSLCL